MRSSAGERNTSTWAKSSRSYDGNPLKGPWPLSPTTQPSSNPDAYWTAASATVTAPSTRTNMVGEKLPSRPEIGSGKAGVLPSWGRDFRISLPAAVLGDINMTMVSFSEEMQEKTEHRQRELRNTAEDFKDSKKIMMVMMFDTGAAIHVCPFWFGENFPAAETSHKVTPASGPDVKVHARRTIPHPLQGTPKMLCDETTPNFSFS